MKTVILAALALFAIAGSAAADQAPASSKCTWTAREIWPVARVLTVGVWEGPTRAETAFTKAMPAAEAAGKTAAEAVAELEAEKTKAPSTAYVGQIICRDGSNTVTVTVQ